MGGVLAHAADPAGGAAIDFARVTLLAVVAERRRAAPAPRITRVTTEPGGLVVEWTAEPLAAAGRRHARASVRRDGPDQAQGRVRFVRVD